MRSRITAIVTSVSLACCAAVNSPASAQQGGPLVSELKELQAQYQKLRINGLIRLNEQQIKKLELLKKKFTRTDDLEHALLVKKEIERLTAEIEQLANELENAASDRAVHRNVPREPIWRQAIAAAKSHSGGKRYYSVFRVVLKNGRRNEKVTVRGHKLKELTAKYDGGGGSIRTVGNGEFVLLDHINSASRKDGQDPVTIESPTRGKITVWIDVPPIGEVNAHGDIVVP